jgi:Xaa-Pro aminopeptidase
MATTEPRRWLLPASLAALMWVCTAPVHADVSVLSMRERAEVINGWLEQRIEQALPPIMRRAGIDTWVIIAREYNEDPVIRTMLPATWLSARRRTILVIHDPGEDQALETLAVARYDVGSVFKKAWDREKQPDQWARLMEILTERDPGRIALNSSETFALADGLSHTEYRLFMERLPESLRERVVPGHELAIGWLETRIPDEMVVYRQICRLAHEILAEGLSEAVIQPGVTTTDDVSWWYRERVRSLKLQAWFHPSVSIQRADPEAFDHLRAFSSPKDELVIQPGDLLHVDFGITYLRLNTDTQQHAYVLRAEEQQAPEALRAALARGNRLQDILTEQFRSGRSGNEILALALAQAKQEGITASIYTHPIGYHGHGAGPTIGMWDQQQGVPGRGDYPLYPNTAYSIELNAASHIDAWGKEIRIMLEEDAYFDGETVRYIDGRQQALHLIPRPMD